ncbi:MAG TPA: HU family DNA-binding protein [Acholeplasmataceae bacterium]|nr:HU family DNA-binding protein [Acholeplasmataceae bacterium]
MNKKEFAEALALKADLTVAQANKALDAFVDVVTEALQAGDSVQLVGFMTLKVSERAERPGRNPATGESIIIPAKKVVKFKAGKKLETAIE